MSAITCWSTAQSLIPEECPTLCSQASALLGAQAQAVEPPGFEPAVFGYDLVSGQYPHDSGAFTEGLLLDRGECDSDGACESYLWESTGILRLAD